MKKTSVNYLPINILNRYELFLVIHGLKPACSVTLKDSQLSYHEKLRKFLAINNLFFEVDNLDESLYFVSRKSEIVDRLGRIWNSEDEKSIREKGELLGYPFGAVEAFVKYAHSPERSFFLALCDDPYGGYILRKDQKEEDSIVAREWREFVEKENPVLAKWLDKKLKPHLNRR